MGKIVLNNAKKTIIFGTIVTILILAFIENKFIFFDNNLAVSSSIWVLMLININVMMLMLLILLVFRHIVKLLYDRKRKVLGAKLQTRLVVAFVFLSLLPTAIFLAPIKFIDTSIKSWFNTSVVELLKNSGNIYDGFCKHVCKSQKPVFVRVIKQIRMDKLYNLERNKDLDRYLKSIRDVYGLDAICVYSEKLRLLGFASENNFEVPQMLSLFEGESINRGFLDKKEMRIKFIQKANLVQTIVISNFDPGPVLYIVCFCSMEHSFYESLVAISEGFDYYNTVLSLKKPIQVTYYITLLIVAFFVVFCAIWFGFYLAKTIITPIMKLVDGTIRIAKGDLTFTIEKTTYDDEIGNLVDSFNKMTKDFLVSQQQLELSAKKLKEQNQEIEERRRYMEMVLKSVSAGVITLDAKGLVTTFNTAAEKMLDLNSNDILHNSYKKIFASKDFKYVGEMLNDFDTNSRQTFEIPLHMSINGLSRSFLASINALQDESGYHIGIVMVFDDLTELEKAQRMAAWREVARRIAHEVKNPLTPITLSAQRLRRKYSDQINESIFDECIHMIIDHVDLIRNLVNEFSTFARFPAANPKPCYLQLIVEEIVGLYKENHVQIEFDVLVVKDIPKMNIDRWQFKQAMINLLDNAIAALKNKGRITIDTRYCSISKLIRIEVADNGPGIKDVDKVRLFEPNFSTKKTGMGLGLTIANTIVTEHHGTICVQDNYPKGAKFIIELPI